jgi:hypothetical protein
MMDVQTFENDLRDSRIFVGVGIDCVRKEWQNCVGVHAVFAKTAACPFRYLGALVKTKAAPATRL